MLHEKRVLLLLLVLALGAASVTTLACGGGTSLDGPQPRVEVVSPATGLKVSATISSVSLGDSSFNASNLQIAFLANDATAAATAAITGIALIDATTGEPADTLTASEPKVWNGSGYEPWNQRVTPGGDLKASYALTTPNWASIDKTENATTRSSSRSYSTPFKLRVTMKIDGVEVVLESSELHREPVAVT